jgi:septal ring factor EnvC (AmiA/AmiB activator)
MGYGSRVKNIKALLNSLLVTRHSSLVTIILFFTFNFSLLTSHFSLVYAADTKQELSEIERKLKQRKQQVKETIKQEKSILSEVDKINKTIKQKQEELKNYENRIIQAQSNIKNLEEAIMTLVGKLDQKKQNLKERLNALYKQHHGERALILITARDYQDLLSRTRLMSLMAYQDRRIIDTFSSEINEANEKKKDLELMRTNLQVSKVNVQKKQKEMSAELTKKDTLLASVRNKRSSYEKMIKELEESSEKLREMIEALDKEKPSEPVTGKGFRALKRRLPWPVDGEVIVPFGKYNDPQYNIPVFKNGIEIRANDGEQPKAVSEGSVVYADWFKGYGLLLIINHGSGYHSLYGHLSEIFYKSGDIIKEGTAVGKIGESGLLNVPSLYFEIRFKGKPVDPMQWLKKNNNKNHR